MITKLLSSLVAATLLTSTRAADSDNRIQFPAAGFSIAPLTAAARNETYQALIMLLPPDGVGSPNVNVQIQSYNGSIEDYMTLTRGQFKAAQLRVIQETPSGKFTETFEYAGDMQGRSLHWYARAEKSGNKVYLVSATTPESLWNKYAVQLKSCVDSFHCNSNAAPKGK